MMEPAGGPEKFLEEHALIVCCDHSQSKVEGEIDLFKAFDGFGLRAAQRSRPDDEIAVCPNSRAAQVYILDRDKRRTLVPRVERTLLALEGVDLVMRMGDHPDGEAIVRGERSRGVKELRFAPRGDLVDARGARWSVEGDLDLLGLKIAGRPGASSTYPDAHEPRLVGAALPDLRRGAGLRPPGLRVPGLGRRAPHRRRLARLAARQRLQRRRCCGRGRTRRSRRASSGRCATSSR